MACKVSMPDLDISSQQNDHQRYSCRCADRTGQVEQARTVSAQACGQGGKAADLQGNEYQAHAQALKQARYGDVELVQSKRPMRHLPQREGAEIGRAHV